MSRDRDRALLLNAGAFGVPTLLFVLSICGDLFSTETELSEESERRKLKVRFLVDGLSLSCCGIGFVVIERLSALGVSQV